MFVSTWLEVSLARWTAILCVLVAVAAARFWLRSSTTHSSSISPLPAVKGARSGVRLVQTNPEKSEKETDIDIIAVHGLDTRSPDTWTWKPQKVSRARTLLAKSVKEGGVNWLQDPHMLPAVVERARIFTCDWPADLFQPGNLVQKTLEEYAQLLLDGIQRDLSVTTSPREHRSLIFIASCLGGIVLIKALVDADQQQSEYCWLRRATRSIVFLGTPFRGTAFEDVANWAEPGIKAWAAIRGRQPNTLLDSVKGPVFVNLVGQFTKLCLDLENPCEVFTFYERGLTNLPNKVFPCLPRFLCQNKTLVDRSSATLDMVSNPLGLERAHVLMNKFRSPECADYVMVSSKIRNSISKIREGNPLQQAQKWICNKHYSQDRLRIERLSGELLPLNECYINLAILEKPKEANNYSKEHGSDNYSSPKSSPFSLSAQLKAETPNKSVQVDLWSVFDTQKEKELELKPRRILIHGRAGVGKTTLCKKIVNDFIHCHMWQGLFDCVLWIPLRKLKMWSEDVMNLEDLFVREFFQQEGDSSKRFAATLAKSIKDEKTLFILDGLDEIRGLLDERRKIYTFLVLLLNQPNAIITSRPHVNLIGELNAPDLELETIGFYPDQVDKYLQNAFLGLPETVSQIQTYLRLHPILQDLVRIPVQLDAFCFAWHEGLSSHSKLDTMTEIYRAIEKKLWIKDILRMGKVRGGNFIEKCDLDEASNVWRESCVQQEIVLLEALAFCGLHEDQIEFDRKFLERFELLAPEGLPGKTLGSVSFLRASDPLLAMDQQSSHFLHLTYQEYFAARFFVRQWRDNARKPLFPEQDRSKGAAVTPAQISQDLKSITPIEYLQKHKYTPKYNILWRFVAGLLDEDNRAKEFFGMLDNAPRDLLGPMHQRLVMHCLSEVSQRWTTTAHAPCWHIKLEQRLVDWMLFECKTRWRCSIAFQSELSPRVLLKVFDQTDAGGRLALMKSMSAQRLLLIPLLFERLTVQLEDKDQDVRRAAVEVLGAQPTLPEETLKRLAARLDDKNRDVRQAAVQVLTAHLTLPEGTLERLAARLEDEDSSIRQAAVAVLGAQATLPEGIFEQLTARLKDKIRDVRQAAVQVLTAQLTLPEGTLKRLAAQLEDEDRYVRHAAVQVLGGQLTLSGGTLERLAARLDDKDSSVRQAAVAVLGAQPTLPEETLERLAARLEDPIRDVRQAAVHVLAAQPTLSEVTREQLAARLDDEDWSVRLAAVEVFRAQPTLSEGTLEQMAAQLEDPDPSVRQAAVQVLIAQSTLPEGTLKQLLAQLEDKIRNIHALAYTEHPTVSEGTLEQLAAQLVDKYCSVRLATVEVLRAQPTLPERTLGRLTAHLEDVDSYVRQAAVEVLGVQATLPQGTLERLAARLEDEYCSIRLAAVAVLGAQSTLPEGTFRRLAARLEDPDSGVRQVAVHVVGAQATIPKGTLERLAARLEDQDSSVRQAAVEVLTAQPALPEVTLEQLAARLEDPDSGVRQAAVEVFRAQSTLPEGTLGRLAAQLEDPNSGVRQAAVEVLGAQLTLPEGTFERLAARLEDVDAYVQQAAVEVLTAHPTLPEGTLERLAVQLEDKTWGVRQAAFKVLTAQLMLSKGTFERLAAQLEDKDSYVRLIAVEVLGAQATLPEGTLERLAARLEDKTPDVRQAAVQVLTAQPTLPTEICWNFTQSLFSLLLEQSWSSDVCWPTTEHQSHLQFNQAAPIAWTSWDPRLEIAIQQIRKEAGLPQLTTLGEK